MVRTDLYSTVFDEGDFRGSASKNPAMLFMYLALRHSNARDFAGKNAKPIEQIAKYQIHHIFPREFMLEDEEAERYRKKRGLCRAQLKEEIDDIANLTFMAYGTTQEIKRNALPTISAQDVSPGNLGARFIRNDPKFRERGNFANSVMSAGILAKARIPTFEI